MFGETVTRYCTTCQADKQLHTTVLYRVDDKEYINKFDCPQCNEDLAKNDLDILRKAKEDGKSIAVVMC